MHIKSLIATAAVALTTAVRADVKPAQLFTDNMVIQRETEAPVWGWADAGEQVTVSGSWGAKASSTADANGKWMVKLQTPEAGGPYDLTFKGNNTVVRKDVLSGDVWLCAGQSNMQLTVSKANNSNEEAAKATFPNIRHFRVGKNASVKPAKDSKGSWSVCSPNTVKRFSATAYFTGRGLHKELNVPIGLINSSWGATSIEAWTALEVQKDDPAVQNIMSEMDKNAAQKKKIKKKNYPGKLFNGMVHPLIPFAIKGAIWYQGEANSHEHIRAEHYRIQLDRLISNWRNAWEQDIPFYFVQLPNFKAAQKNPVETQNVWPVTRDSFIYVLKNTTDTGMAVTIDIGLSKNIHPKNKQDVGARMASTILNKTYGKSTPTSPIFKSCNIIGNKAVIAFDYTGAGLSSKGGELKTFAIAGADKQFVWADAKIEKKDGINVVVVSSNKVKTPVAVRYAWADNPDQCNLYSKEGFPTSPFRTDDWSLAGE